MSETTEQELAVELPKKLTFEEKQLANKRLEDLLITMYKNRDDKFFAYLFFGINRVLDNQACPTMGVGIIKGKLTLIYNTEFLAKLTDYQAIEILKHECKHIIHYHLQRGKGAAEKDRQKAQMENIAMDCAINQDLDIKVIEDIGGITLKSFRGLLKGQPSTFNLEPNGTFDYYMELLENEVQDRKDKGEGTPEFGDFEMDDHGNFGNMDALDQIAMEKAIQKAGEDAKADGAGKIPKEVEEILARMNKPVVNWKRQLKQFMGNGIRAEKSGTRSRRNRKWGITQKGRKKNYIAKVLVVLDTSGSMSGGRTDAVLNEVYGIWKNNPTTGIDICECDAQINEVFEYKGKGEFPITGRGGTDMEPALEYAQKHKYDGVIMLTDGEFWNEDFTKYRIPSLWVIAGNKSYTSPVGKTIHIDA